MNKTDVTVSIKADAGDLTKTMQNVQHEAHEMSEKIKAGAKSTQSVGQVLKGQVMGAITKAISGFRGFGQAIGAAVKTGLGPIGLLMGAIEAIKGLLDTVMRHSQKWGDGMSKIFSQVGAVIQYVLDPTNWGTGFVDGIKQAWAIAGELAEATDNVGTYTMEWEAKQKDLNATLSESQAIISDTAASAEDHAKALDAAKKAAQEYQAESKKFVDAKRAELTAMAKEVALRKNLNFTAEEYKFLIEEGIKDTDKLKAMGGKWEEFADALDDATQESMLKARSEMKETERAANQYIKSVNRLAKTQVTAKAEINVKPKLPAGSIAELKKQIEELRKKQELTVPCSVEFYMYETAIEELQRKLTGDDGTLLSIPLKADLDVTDVTKNLELVGEKVEDVIDTKSAMKGLQGVFGSLGDAVKAVGSESEAAAAAVQMLAIAEQIAAMASAIHTAAQGDPYSVAARIIAAAAAVTSSIVAIQQLSKRNFTEGGIVEGQFTAGDRITVGVNAGEMILNKRQQAALFDQLNKPSLGGGGLVEFRIQGRDLVGVLNETESFERRSR